MPPPIAPAARLRADLDLLAEEVSAIRFALPSADREKRAERRDRLVTVVNDYLIPRLGDPTAPLLVVVAGPTGSGKSTLVNSLAEREISSPGALRPTTRSPVVWCHPDHASRYEEVGGVAPEIVAEDHPLLTDLSVVDTPDIDSYVADHRRVTLAILGEADVVVFVTSAQRYADAVPWEILDQVEGRGSRILFVLNRLSRRASGAVSDYRALLRRHGIEASEIHSVSEQRLRGAEGLLPPRSISRVAEDLRQIASQREEVLREITYGATLHAVALAGEVADDVLHQADERRRLQTVVDQTYADAMTEVAQELDRGALIRREVVDRWSERVEAGDLARFVRGSAGWIREMADRVAGRPTAGVGEMEREAHRELTQAVVSRLSRAARAVATAWEVDPAVRELVTSDLREIGPGSQDEVVRLIERWLAGLTRMVQEEAPGRFRLARVASTGMNAAAVGTVLALFAATGGLSGAEVGVAAGAAAAQQAVLEQILGRAAARSLAGSARDTLLDSIEAVFDTEANRFRRILALASDSAEGAERIQKAAAVVARESESFHAG